MKPLILVVEDEAVIAMALQYELEAGGFRTLVAFNLAEARSAIAEERPDLVLLDLNLNGEPGALLAVELLSTGINVVLCTGDTELDRDTTSVLAGLSRLPKPYEEAALLSTVRHALSQPAPGQLGAKHK